MLYIILFAVYFMVNLLIADIFISLTEARGCHPFDCSKHFIIYGLLAIPLVTLAALTACIGWLVDQVRL